MNPTITVDFLRLHFNSSSTVETALSVNAIELVTAANNTSTKIANDAEIVAKVKQFTPSFDDVMEF